MSERLMTVAEVAALLKCSPETVTRRFAREKGVIDLAAAGSTRRRRYRVLRIPRTVVERYALMRGGHIHVPSEPAPTKPKPATSKTPTPKAEDDVLRDLAALAQQSGAEARRTVERIARRAKLMTYVKPEDWERIIWLDDDE
jgi:AcrR family transcriptional regulator